MTIIERSLNLNIYTQAILCCLGFMIFSFFIHSSFPLITISFIGLAFPAAIIGVQINSFSDLIQKIDFIFPKKIGLYLFIGLQLGLIYAIVYRNISGMKLFPVSLTQFAATAAVIGATEEIIFRGFIQKYFKKISLIFALLFATFSHTAYKCCLFLSPAISVDVNIYFLAIWTFVGGLLFGILKEISKSVVPAVIAHMLFDILVYGECLNAPWWVW